MKWVMRTCHFQTYLKVKKMMSNKTCREFRKSVSLGLRLCSWISCRLPSVFLEFSVGAWQMWSCQVLSLQLWESPTLDPYPQHPEKPLQSPFCDTWSATLWMPSSDWWVTCSWCKVPKLAKLAVLIQNGKMVPKFWSRTWLTQTSRVSLMDQGGPCISLPLLGEWLLECLHGQFWDCPGWRSTFCLKVSEWSECLSQHLRAWKISFHHYAPAMHKLHYDYAVERGVAGSHPAPASDWDNQLRACSAGQPDRCTGPGKRRDLGICHFHITRLPTSRPFKHKASAAKTPKIAPTQFPVLFALFLAWDDWPAMTSWNENYPAFQLDSFNQTPCQSLPRGFSLAERSGFWW